MMKNKEKFEKAFNYFKESYSYKMGGTQTVILPNGKSKFFDDREYYSGRGAKYNNSIRHDIIGDVKVSKKEYSVFLKLLKDRERVINERRKAAAEKVARYEEFKNRGLYEIENFEYGNFVNLSKDESNGKYFDAERLAKTLDISIKDAELLNSQGKTYVFAKQINTGKLIRLFHSDLICNPLSISVDFDSEKQYQEFLKDREIWISAPYANLVGQSDNENHFVC